MNISENGRRAGWLAMTLAVAVVLNTFFSPAAMAKGPAQSSSVCRIEADYDPRASAPVEVELRLICLGSLPASVTWSLGDGNYANGNPVSHTYIADADYLVSAESEGRTAALSATLHIPGFMLLDDFEDQASTLEYWGFVSGSDDAAGFLRGLETRDESGTANTEYRITVWGSGHSDGGGSYGGSGLVLPPIGPGGGQTTFGDPGPIESYDRAQIVFDLRTEMDWQKIATASAPLRFVVMSLVGPEVRLVAKVTGSSELYLSLQTDSASSDWVNLGSIGDLDSRVAVKWLANRGRSQAALEWRLRGGDTVRAAALQVPEADPLLGFQIVRSRADSENGSLPPLFELGFLFLDNFEYADYVDQLLQSTF